jgi:hypothetical protein
MDMFSGDRAASGLRMRNGRTRWRIDGAPIVGLAVALCGAALLVVAWRTNGAWLDRHILPSFFTVREVQIATATSLRLLLTMLGLAIVFLVAPFLARRARGQSVGGALFTIAMTLLATMASISTAELVLRTQSWGAAWEVPKRKEPARLADPALGWVLKPGHHGEDSFAGRRIDYWTDRFGYRVADGRTETDMAAPSILFTGESAMAGHGLPWEETIPAQVQARVGLQSVNLSVNGYSSDQAYLRLKRDLPGFSCPVAVVSFFMTGLLDRNINTDRPHLDAQMRWQPGRTPWRLAALAERGLHYRSTGAIDEGIAMTRAVLKAGGALAEARGATSLLIVPVYWPEDPNERALRHKLLDEAGIRYVLVPLDRRWRIIGDSHPDARAADAIAAAIAVRLDLRGISARVSPVEKRVHATCEQSDHS